MINIKDALLACLHFALSSLFFEFPFLPLPFQLGAFAPCCGGQPEHLHSVGGFLIRLLYSRS